MPPVERSVRGSQDAPPYPEYPDLVDQARRAAPRFVSKQDLDRYRDVVTARGADWCSGVLGRAFPGLRALVVWECELLTVADDADLTPPVPAPVLAQRAEAARRHDLLTARRAELEERDASAWAEALAGCTVPVEVHANLSGQRVGTGLAAGPLRHAVAVIDAVSGPLDAPRSHPAGRAVCERVERPRPRRLAPATDRPATCRSCLALVGRLRPAPGPPAT